MFMNSEQMQDIAKCVLEMKDGSTDNPVIPMINVKIMSSMAEQEGDAALRTANLERLKRLVCIIQTKYII